MNTDLDGSEVMILISDKNAQDSQKMIRRYKIAEKWEKVVEN